MAAQNPEENLRNSIFSINVSKSARSVPVRKGTACAVKIEGSTRVVLVTSSKAVEHHGGKLSSTRLCLPDYEDEHLVMDTLEPRYTVQQFCFIPLQTTPKCYLKLVSTNKLRTPETRKRLIQSICLSYTFFGNSFKTLTWEFNEEEETHELTKVDPKGDLVTSACRGSPVISTQDEDRSVIGVVDCTSDGDLCLTFFEESSFNIEDLSDGQTDDPALDVTDSPVIPRESTTPVPPAELKQFNAEENNPSQENRPGVSSSPTDVSGPLTQLSIEETMHSSEKQKISLKERSEEIKCLWEQEVQSLDGFQDLLTSVLKINLDPKRELGGDYRSLAGELGKDMKYIWYLTTTPSPIEELLRECRPTLSFLKKLLLYKEVGREDVAKEITAWVKKKGCRCSECGFSIR